MKQRLVSLSISNLSAARKAVMQIVARSVSPDLPLFDDIQLVAGEAIMNAVKDGGDTECAVNIISNTNSISVYLRASSHKRCKPAIVNALRIARKARRTGKCWEKGSKDDVFCLEESRRGLIFMVCRSRSIRLSHGVLCMEFKLGPG